MKQHLLIVSVDGVLATLRSRSGSTFQVPTEWLPEGAREGGAIIVETGSHAGAGNSLVITLAIGTSEPEGTDVGA